MTITDEFPLKQKREMIFFLFLNTAITLGNTIHFSPLRSDETETEKQQLEQDIMFG